jgi:4-alpha-glucanotransferase
VRLTLDRRAGGILLHLTSLPGPYGTGDLGPASRDVARFLAESGQGWWQMLPIGPPGGGDSPYSATSSFAGSPLLVSLDDLVPLGLLRRDDLHPPTALSRGRIDYRGAAAFRDSRLRLAAERFFAGKARERREFDAFRRRESRWIEDDALFHALKDAHGGGGWLRWPAPLRRRERGALAEARRALAAEIRYRAFVQYLFACQWDRFRGELRERNVGLIGDVPIFVSHDSADVWVHQDIFRLDRDGRPEVVAGVPPDYFSRTGQRWGNPVYRWDVLKRRGYDWWLDRLDHALARFDVVRLDHFIGFHRTWVVPARAKTALRGIWAPGPGASFFEAARNRLGGLPFIAEDLGLVTPEVLALRDRFSLPGIRVLQFGFRDGDGGEYHRPHRHPPRSVAYTGTHDNDTVVGWFRGKGAGSSTRTPEEVRRERAFLTRYLGGRPREIHWAMIRLAWGSPADTAIVPVQDLLGLGSAARMNRPGTAQGNWQWRLADGALDRRLAHRLAELSETFSRT